MSIFKYKRLKKTVISPHSGPGPANPPAYAKRLLGCTDCTTTESETGWDELSRVVMVLECASTATVALKDRPLALLVALTVTVAVVRSSVCSKLLSSPAKPRLLL